ncbi:anthranilate synthase component 1 [Motilimonas cestriensis]|uniref:anthranilate synthase component 1 n=1 Tax=Motilimonas cestriensis TaxID=2742685 RepID=UPI003DA234ED
MNTSGYTGELATLRRHSQYSTESLPLYQALSRPGDNSLLLDSAEIDSKADLKSLMLLDAAVRIACHGLNVTMEALTDNGYNLLVFLTEQFESNVAVELNERRLTLTFPEPDRDSDEDTRLKSHSPVDGLRTIINTVKTESDLNEALFIGGAFSYDFIGTFESLPDVPNGTNQCPDYLFYVAETLLLQDHQQQQCELIGSVFSGPNSQTNQANIEQRLQDIATLCENFTSKPITTTETVTSKVSVDVSDVEFCRQVETLKSYIRKGDIFQVVPSRSFSLECPCSLSAYGKLKETNPSPYMFYLNDQDFVLFGASPESAIKYCHQSNDVEIYPIAGTRRRGFNPDGSINKDLDGRIELELRLDKKEMSEHLMLVDLARNDVARISEPGTRHVADLLKVDRYSHVMHLVSRVVGKLRSDLDALHAYQACMNMGTLTGAPKIRASELIRETEQQRRGSYGGAVGYLTGQGEMDTCIVIRSAFVQNQVAHVQAGAGVVYDSKPQAEADETRSKAAAVLNAIAQAHGTTLEAVNNA